MIGSGEARKVYFCSDIGCLSFINIRYSVSYISGSFRDLEIYQCIKIKSETYHQFHREVSD